MRRQYALLGVCAIIATAWFGSATPSATQGQLGTPVVDHFGCVFLRDTGAATAGDVEQRLWLQKTTLAPHSSLDGTTDLSARWAADVLIVVEAPDTEDGASQVTLTFDPGGTVYFWNEGACESQTDVGCEEECVAYTATDADTLVLDQGDSVFISRAVPYNIFNESESDAVLWVAAITDDEAGCPPCTTWP